MSDITKMTKHPLSPYREISLKSAICSDLHKALKGHEIGLHYQPIYDIETEQVVALEALLRWEHPSEGLISPGLVLEYSRIAGLELDLLISIFERAFSDLPMLESRYGNTFFLSINFSPAQLSMMEFPDILLDMVKTVGLAPNRLWIEITERERLNVDAMLIEKLTRLSNEGMHITLDDFGAGYSSADYLCKLPVSVVKFDRSIVESVDECSRHRLVMNGLVDIAQRLSVSVVAEGVSTYSQVEHLKAMGIKLFQGFLLSHPKSATDWAASDEIGVLLA